ncbi:MAG: DUF1223 domain-containing protein [Pyrinomonadaceae bacterium]
MRRWIITSVVALGLVAIALGALGERRSSTSFVEAEEKTDSSTDFATGTKVNTEGRVPVIVELFTSEGCSSCPPADAVLTRLEQSQPITNVKVIALGQHVDYWNYLGWKDRFSAPIFGERQSQYAGLFGSGRYTPQIVVDGSAELVGSNMSKARAVIAEAARNPKARINLSLAQPEGQTKKDELNLSIRVDGIPSITNGDTADVLLAITEDNLQSSVTSGENSGRALLHNGVVRQIGIIGNISSATFTAESDVRLADGWKHKNLNAVVFVQERQNRRIIGAAEISLAQ